MSEEKLVEVRGIMEMTKELREQYKGSKIITAIKTLHSNLGGNGDVAIICSEALKEFESMVIEKENLYLGLEDISDEISTLEYVKTTKVNCTKETVSFDEWFSRFERYFALQGATDEALMSLDKEAYRGYYDDGCNIKEAFEEECGYSE